MKQTLCALIVLSIVSCSPSATPIPTPDAKGTETKIAANIFATQTASVPTATSTSSPVSSEKMIQIIDWNWYLSGTGNYIYVDGEVQNTSSEAMRYVQIFIKLMDTNDTLLATDKGYIDADILNPGAKSTFKLMTAFQRGIKTVAITNIQWEWAGKGTPIALKLPTNTPRPSPTSTTTRTLTPTPAKAGDRFISKGLNWKVSRVEFTKILQSTYAPDTRTAKGIYLVVIVDLDWDDLTMLKLYQGVTEFEAYPKSGQQYSYLGFPESLVAEARYITDPAKQVLYYTRANSPTPYPKGKILQDVFVYDVPDDKTSILFRRVGYPSQVVTLR